ncbi:MAG: YggS family pyridoxal phosphate-dependent enzyme [Clostridiales bacterium]|nr:YggS family pyridoxal phosphate-dependent enzyme [Clostridiales bacterium]
MSDNFALIEKNIENIKKQLALFPDAKLMAVIKNRSNDEVMFAKSCGIDCMGENHAQEFLSHLPCLDGVKTDFIGTLQSNKVKYLVGKINIIESVSSASAVKEIARLSQKNNVQSKILIEVNTGKEEQKSGVLPENLSEFLGIVSEEKMIDVLGLMAVAPVTANSDEKRKYFALLRKLRDENISSFRGYDDHPLLSMGMTDSYMEALEEGSDIIRIGTGIFGPRNYATTHV